MALAPEPLDSAPRLRPVLGLFSAAAIVVGGTIGSGVFLKPKTIALGFLGASSSTESAEAFVPLILGLWIICGLVNLCGALALAELSTMMPHAGGNYVYLREAYGRLWAFLWGWAEFWVIRSGSTAALAAAMTILLKELLSGSGSSSGRPDVWYASGLFEIGFPIAIVALLATVNIIGTRWGGAVQNITTVIKAGFVVFLAALPFVATGSEPIRAEAWAEPLARGGLLAAIGGSLAAIMWAYDGWGMVTVVAEEIRNPRRNLPLALAGGVVFLTLLYFGANLAYHQAMSTETLARVDNPAVALTGQVFGAVSAKVMLAMLMVSVFGALNSNLLVGPRVLFAVARDHAFLGWLRRVSPTFGTPALAIAALSTWTCVLVLLGALSPDPRKRLFDVLTEYCVFGGSLFYLAAVVAVFVLRWKRPYAERPYRTWGYPVVPAVFVLFYIGFVTSMLWSSWREALTGLALIGLGAVAYGVAGLFATGPAPAALAPADDAA